MQSYILAETNWKTVKETEYQLAVLPWGATEAHNYHLPYATDNILVYRIAEESARIAWDCGAKVIVLPTVPYGVNTGQKDVKLDMNLNPSTQMMILKDLIAVLDRQGIHKLAIMNGHGGNDFKQMIRELNLIYPNMFICQVHWFKIPGREKFFEDLGEHAGEDETSMMQYLTSDLALPLSMAGEGKAKVFSIKAFREGWAWAERNWSEVTSDTGVGNPSLANKEKGEAFFQYVTERIGAFLFEVAIALPEELYKDPD